MDVIRSAQNPALRRARAVLAGKEPGFLALEGDRLVDEALRRGLPLELCLVAAERGERARELRALGAPVQLVDGGVLQRASALVTSPGVLAVAPAPAPLALGALRPSLAPLVAVACGIADPGNLGALARTAEAAGAGALVLVGGASPWNPKALRGSMGSLLRLRLVIAEHAGAVRAALDRGGWRQARAAARGGALYDRFDWRPPLALWIASETGALPAAAGDVEAVTIPMAGPVESLNVTTAAAVLLFAARGAAARAAGGLR